MQSNFFNLDIQDRTGNDLIKEGVHYKIVNDGNGVPRKIINFENPEICPREGIIQLHPMRLSTRHENRLGLRVCVDRTTGIIYGIPTGINEKTKEIEFMKINLVDAETLDLSIPVDAMKWTVLKNSYFVEGSPNLRGKPKYKVHDVEKIANNFLNQRSQRRKAVDIAEGLAGSQLVDMARNLGIPPESNSVPTMHMEVIKRAEDSPKTFMEIWDSPTRIQLTVLKRSIAAGVVVFDTVLGFTYNGSPLGATEGLAVEFLKDYPQICQAIDMLSKKQENASVKAMAKMEVKPILDDKDARIAALEAQLAASDAVLKTVASEKMIVDVTAEINPEMAELLAEAKRLNVRGAHLIKDPDKLREKINEKQGIV
jgi:hypothetical protein